MDDGGRGSIEARPPRFPPRYRLKRSVQLFPASDGSLYLLRLGAGDDLVVSHPRPIDRALLGALAEDSKGRGELATLLAAAGHEQSELDVCLRDLEQAGVLETRRGERLLDPVAAERYDRQLIYFADLATAGEQPDELQLRLAAARVAIIGCGGLGSWVACGLASAGIGSLVLIDDDEIELSNLNRQLLFTEHQLGAQKIFAAREALCAHNSRLDVVPIRARIRCIDDLEAVLAWGPDIVVLTADWPPHDLPRWVNHACLGSGVPWIGAGQFPPRLRVGPFVVPGRSACLECLELAARRDHPLYEELAAWRRRHATPDASVGAVSGVIGSLLACEVIHFLLGAFKPASVGGALLFDLRSMVLEREAVGRDPDCGECGRLDGIKALW